nr:GAP family protein [Actinomycetospora corticicola]
MAIGVALSPVPMIAVVLVLTSRQARSNSLAFVIGWLTGLAVVGTIVLTVAGEADASVDGSPAAWVSWAKIVLGAGLLLIAVRRFRGRPRNGDEAALPRWMATVDTMKPVAVFGLAAASPKNLLLATSAGAEIAQSGIPTAQQAVAYAVFALIASIGVGTPLAIYYAMGRRSQVLLASLKSWLGHHNAVIVSVLCLVLATKLIGEAIGALTS